MKNLSVNIPTSFVKRQLKYKNETGSGEAKLFIGNTQRISEFNELFNDFTEEKMCVIFKKNLLDYLRRIEIEYIGHKYGDYKEVDLNYYKDKVKKISELEQKEYFFRIDKYEDKNRVYIRTSNDDKWVFDLIREIALPKITDLVISNKNGVIEFILDLNYEFLDKQAEKEESIAVINKDIYVPHQRIFFGAPGTGKSFRLNQEAKDNFGDNYERVTFHPNYMYGNFVGAFKPFPEITGEKYEGGKEKEVITYKYVPGPLIKILVKALQNPDNPYVLIIEEINRANAAAVFGDFFQLLDRDSSGKSEYPIVVSEDLEKYLIENSKTDSSGSSKMDSSESSKTDTERKVEDKYSRLILPSNLYIWCTMNSADQGVMPMDTAFKRRWDFTYIGVDEALEDDEIAKSFDKYRFNIKNKEVKWDDFRREVNKKLLNCGVPEDKLLGPFFLSKTILEKSPEEIKNAIKNKVLMYLYEDAGKPYRFKLFEKEMALTYSSLCENFEKNGEKIFKEPMNLENYKDNNYDKVEEVNDPKIAAEKNSQDI